MDTEIKQIETNPLDNLTPAERELALSILKEYAETGSSEKLSDLLYEDYAEVPVDILTFVDDYNYLGNAWHDAEGKTKLYPYWRKELQKIFPNNLDTNVNNAIFSGSRGRGKSEISSLCMAYLLHRILCLKDPVAHFHLKPTEKIVFAFMNIKLELAEEIGIAKFQNTLQSSPWFMNHGTLEGRTKKVWVPQKYNGQEAIDIKIGSQSDDLIGLPIYAAFFDEVSFQRNKDVEKQKQKANDMIDTAIGGMKTRFVHKGKNPTLLMLASSKRSDKSFLEEHMKKKLKSEKDNVYISDGSVWEVKPEGTYSSETFKVALGNKFLASQVVPEGANLEELIKKGYKLIDVPVDFRADFIDDIDRALCDFAGISSSSITKYISGQAVTDIITDRIQNPFQKEILEIGNGPDDETQYYNFFDLSKIDPKLKNKPLFIHLDMSISGDKTGIAGVVIKGKKPSTDPELQNKDLFYSLLFSVSIKAPRGRQISFDKNRNFIYWLKNQGFNIKGITTDTFQSYDTGQTLKAKGYPYDVLSVDRVEPQSRICKPYQYFKSTIYDKRIEIYDHRLLIQEITELERNIDTGKVDHPDSGCFTGETKVALVDGRQISFLELVKEYNEGKQNYVYSMNLDTHKIEPKLILKAWKTLENQPLVRLTFDNGEIVECTLNHKFMLRNGEYLEAENLIPGDSLMPLYTKIGTKGLEGYRMYYEPFEDKWHYEHRQFASEVLDIKYLVHHKNCNKLDNSPTNLLWCSKEAHKKIHDENQTGAQSTKARLKRSNSVKQWHEENKGSQAYKDRAEKLRQKSLQHNLEKVGYNTTLIEKQRIKDIESFFNITWDKLSVSEKNSYGTKWTRMNNPEIQKKISASVSQRHARGKFINAERALQKHNETMRELKKLFPKVEEQKFKNLFGFEYQSLPKSQKAPWSNRYRQKLYEVINHKLVSIEFIDKKADVYDIEVADNHNFALAAGIFVHNSKDCSDAVCGALYNASSHAEEFAYDYGEMAEQMLRINETPGQYDARQLTLDMEEELKKIGPNIRPNDWTQKTTDYSLTNSDIIDIY